MLFGWWRIALRWRVIGRLESFRKLKLQSCNNFSLNLLFQRRIANVDFPKRVRGELSFEDFRGFACIFVWGQPSFASIILKSSPRNSAQLFGNNYDYWRKSQEWGLAANKWAFIELQDFKVSLCAILHVDAYSVVITVSQNDENIKGKQRKVLYVFSRYFISDTFKNF